MKGHASAYDETPLLERAGFVPGDEQRWLMQYLPLVKRIVGQLSFQSNQVLDREDMEQIGLMGLLEGLRRYGPPDEQFGSFAALRIRGAILDELRRQDWRPRQLRQRVHRVRDVIRQLTRELGREPNDIEIREAADLSETAYQDYLQADSSEALESLDKLLQSGQEAFPEPGDSLEERFVKERLLEQALESLSERERLVLTLYYQYELSLKEIALVLEVSDARVCQLSKQALKKASRYLSERP